MEQVISDYLESLDIPISKNYCKQAILEHPDYPSLLSVADVLDRLGVDYEVGQVEKKHLQDLPFPCVLHLDEGGGKFVVVERKSDLETDEIDLEHWDGVVLKAESTDTIVDTEHNEQLASEKKQGRIAVVLGAALVGLIALPVIQGLSWLYLSLFATAMAGSIIGYLLVAKDLGVTYEPVETFCNARKGTNCDRILNAEEANLFGSFSFADATASYFISQLLIMGLCIPLLGSPASFMWLFGGAAIATLPVIGYSLYY
ncbi:hypothetical protein [Fodinibius halophilus]|uniref:Peptidase C39 domain-containing protein n=1 Tax=Fodinibius halophilus TaxID=1736908 RepID=A0A6M1T4X9_9BACT|nr:hypothetical protein [Fodinibius halophilus]NGP87733.1 hypothetical protein [Fodinibius halophilus]